MLDGEEIIRDPFKKERPLKDQVSLPQEEIEVLQTPMPIENIPKTCLSEALVLMELGYHLESNKHEFLFNEADFNRMNYSFERLEVLHQQIQGGLIPIVEDLRRVVTFIKQMQKAKDAIEQFGNRFKCRVDTSGLYANQITFKDPKMKEEMLNVVEEVLASIRSVKEKFTYYEVNFEKGLDSLTQLQKVNNFTKDLHRRIKANQEDILNEAVARRNRVLDATGAARDVDYNGENEVCHRAMYKYQKGAEKSKERLEVLYQQLRYAKRMKLYESEIDLEEESEEEEEWIKPRK